ncbi:UDP-galactopyranose mutase [Fibrobacter sp. UWP2]|uniref:UDP-galactopyranose mutase n=1 Tax=Fibrobacter sp. UWP2 TaxID=1896216 RepID=UPI00091D314B|nr:UDP-galactopyranose mutase [Fibrobacter sp. UWP2]SHJ29841.1 UDP-galactopyranose mutase [Fibrobacter sp. UWP2]
MLDYLVVGSGLFGATFAHLAKKAGKSVMVVEKRPHVAGNCYTENVEGIDVHKYGAHIFHTSNARVWNFVNSFVPFNRYTNSPVALSRGRLFNLPFNMNTFYQLWGVKTPAEAMAKIEEQRAASGVTEPRNLEEQALSLVGRDVYEALIKEYTEKQWGRKCTELPTSVIKRLPVRFTFDNNYFNDLFQGIPVGGYTGLVKAMLEGIEVRLDMDFLKCRSELESLAKKIVYTGPIDEFFSFRLGTLEYRSLRFETELLDCTNFQGNAVVNYIDASVPYTRIIEHKHFEFGEQPKTVITREYPMTWEPGKERFYTVNDEKNSRLYQEYVALSKQLPNVIFGGRLAEYKYYDMDDVIERAMDVFSRE